MNERVCSLATVVAVGVTDTGERTVLGVDAGICQDHVFWTQFLRSLVKRGLKGVQLVISDAHEGLVAAIAKVLQGAQWQRCRVHFMRNLLSVVPKDAQPAVATIVKMIFMEPDHASASAQLRKVAGTLEHRFPRAPTARRRGRGSAGPPSLSDRAPPPAALHQSTRTVTQRDQAKDSCRWDLPQPICTYSADWCLARRAGRRVADRRPPVLQRRIDGADRQTRGR